MPSRPYNLGAPSECLCNYTLSRRLAGSSTAVKTLSLHLQYSRAWCLYGGALVVMATGSAKGRAGAGENNYAYMKVDTNSRCYARCQTSSCPTPTWARIIYVCLTIYKFICMYVCMYMYFNHMTKQKKTRAT